MIYMNKNERIRTMNKEEFKAEFLRIAKEEPAIIGNLAMKFNIGNTIREAVYADERIYVHNPLDLLVRIKRNSESDKVPKFDIQFYDERTPPLEWGNSISGELGMHNSLIRIFQEQIKFVNGMLEFWIIMTEIVAQGDETILSQSSTYLHNIYHDLKTGGLGRQKIDLIRKKGRGTSKYLQNHYLDCVFGEEEYQKLLQELTDWGNQNEYTEDEMKQIKLFCEYCKFVKSTKAKSKMMRIFEYLEYNRLHHRV